MKAKRRFFSLVEVILSLTLIAIAAAILIAPNKRALSKKQFSTSMSQLSNSIALARQLAFNYDTTITLHFDMEKEALRCHFECDDALKDSLKSLTREFKIEGVKKLSYHHQDVSHLKLHYVAKAGLQEGGAVKITTRFFEKPIALGLD